MVLRPTPRNRPARPSVEEIRAANAAAREALGHIYQAMLKTPEFTLPDGRKGRVEHFYAPEVNNDGELKCAIDVRLDDGSHLEFTVGHTGWGRSFANGEAWRDRPKSAGRQP